MYPFIFQALMSPQHVLSCVHSIAFCGASPTSNSDSCCHLIPVAARSASVFHALYNMAHELLNRHASSAVTGAVATFAAIVRCLIVSVMQPGAEKAEDGAGLITR